MATNVISLTKLNKLSEKLMNNIHLIVIWHFANGYFKPKTHFYYVRAEKSHLSQLFFEIFIYININIRAHSSNFIIIWEVINALAFNY